MFQQFTTLTIFLTFKIQYLATRFLDRSEQLQHFKPYTIQSTNSIQDSSYTYIVIFITLQE